MSALVDRIADLEAAISNQVPCVARARAEQIAAHNTYNSAAANVASDLQAEAITELRAGFASLGPAFSRLIASDIVRRETVGDVLAMDDKGNRAPWSTLVLGSLLNTLNTRVRPDNLYPSKLQPAAREIAAATLDQMKIGKETAR